jgi:hypothetical protein
LILPKSISLRLTIIRIRVISSVPPPAMALRSRLAKNVGGLWTHSTEKILNNLQTLPFKLIFP